MPGCPNPLELNRMGPTNGCVPVLGSSAGPGLEAGFKELLGCVFLVVRWSGVA